MRVAVLIVLVGIGLIVVALVGQLVFAQGPDARFSKIDASDGVIPLLSDNSQSQQQLLLIDPKKRVVSVYHIERTTGEISLKSVRNVYWDFLMDDYNNGIGLSPHEIRSQVEQR